MAEVVPTEDGSLETRPGILLIGAPNVGKRTILSRLLSIDIEDASDLSEGVLCQGWKIETKYYSANISIWTAHLSEDFSLGMLPISNQLAGLVMIFDMNDDSTFLALKDWVAKIDLGKFEILLCIGNKVDLVPGHSAHVEYRRFMQKRGESASDPHPEFWDYGINEEEGCSLLGDEDSVGISKTCLEWCVDHNIEYVEACASDANFDKCLSTDGDIQGVQRLYGALSAHMWPGMILKSGEAVTTQSPITKEESTDDDSDSNYEVEYEVLSRGSDEPWEFVGVSNNDLPSTSKDIQFVNEEQLTNTKSLNFERGNLDVNVGVDAINTNSETCSEGDKEHEIVDEIKSNSETEVQNGNIKNIDSDDESFYGPEDMEKLMCEIGSMRDNVRLMPDFQRREMAAKLAMKMASMFGYSTEEEGMNED